MDVATNSRRLRIGVVGLGRLWESRHKPALTRLSERFRVTAVYDQVARRAEIEAGQLGCVASDALTDLIQRADVDAVYLISPQWFGLHAAHLACEAGKPVYCAVPIAGDLDQVERLAERVESSGVVFMPEFARRVYPATLRLRELLAMKLGAPRVVVGHGRLLGFDRYAIPGPTTQIVRAPLLIDPGSYLLDWCMHVFGREPESIAALGTSILRSGNDDSAEFDYESFTASFAGGATAQLSFGHFHRSEWGGAEQFLPAAGIQVFAERGVAWLEPPDRIQWRDDDGVHDERIPLEPAIGDVLNSQFHRLVHQDDASAPTIRDVLKLARLLHILQESRRGGRVEIPGILGAPGGSTSGEPR